MASPEPWVLIVIAASGLNLVVWGWFATRVLRLRRARQVVPHYVTAAAIVGTFAASAAGLVAALSLGRLVDPWLARMLIWACWGGLFIAGAYAGVAAIRGALSARTRRREPPRE